MIEDNTIRVESIQETQYGEFVGYTVEMADGVELNL